VDECKPLPGGSALGAEERVPVGFAGVLEAGRREPRDADVDTAARRLTQDAMRDETGGVYACCPA
jgi:hypothetical protein